MAIAALGIAALPLVTAVPAFAIPPPDDVSIEVVKDGRYPCMGKGAAAGLSDDHTSFTVYFGDFSVSTGGDAPPNDWRKNCGIRLRIEIPAGYTYAVEEVDHQGSAGLQAGVSASKKTHFYFDGFILDSFLTHTLKGPYEGAWTYHEIGNLKDPLYKPCDRQRDFMITKELRVIREVSDPSKMSYMSIGSREGSTRYHFLWKHCPA
ncbi:DUF4360 domain-containing protein [Actinomadura macra]|uniref:DUF4360 domain-containing protein n=1 Tax=Actinomadura macra TaxID=46164 RepID=UPI00082E2335|nr:DUF4360 domain-containing protein [Actinomadura macra]